MGRTMLAKGIDVSAHQGKADWEKVKSAGVDFVMVRVGYRGYATGKITEDKRFMENITGAEAAGLDIGAYFFSTSLTEAEAREEAEYCVRKLQGHKVTLPVVFDFEGYNDPKYRTYGITKAQRTNNCMAFISAVRAAGYGSMLYGSQGNIRTTYDIDKLRYPLWIAKYAGGYKTVLGDDKYFPQLPGHEERIAMWQYTSIGRVDGIVGNVDMDYMYVSGKEEIEKEAMELKGNEYVKGKATQLSKNFKSTEFDCHGRGCCSVTPIDPKLVAVLQAVRDHFGCSVIINCGYRCAKHNAEVSGASKTSKHLSGQAADIAIKGVHPMRIARYVETVPGFAGRIGCYTWSDAGSGFVHVDVRGTNSRAVYVDGNTKYDTVSGFTTSIRRRKRGRIVTVVQRRLAAAGLYVGKVDGSCGAGTEAAILAWNRQHGRPNDKVWGPACWQEAFPV